MTTKSVALALGLAVGCGEGSTPDVDPPDPPDGWTDLIGRSWDIEPGSFDTYRCTRIRVDEDMWVTGFRAIAPVGTHHTVVTISQSGNPLGDYDCGVGSLDFQMLYASGVGTDDLVFPTGVAMQLRAGQFVNLNLHLFNASDNPITGTSGIQVQRIAEQDVVHEADMVFAGNMDFEVAGDGEPHEIRGGCTAPSGGWNVFTLWPHMHQFATHQKFEIARPGEDPQVLLDDDFLFEEQINYPITEIHLPAGTGIQTTCTYVNPGPDPITFGDSSNQEMCFTGMYKYPAGGLLFQCAL